MFEQDAYMPVVQLLNPKVKYMGNKKSILTLVIYALAIHYIKLSSEKREPVFDISCT